MNRLGGSLFVRNAIQYDYCVVESILSLLGVCDEVVVLECSSEDDTKKLLKSIKSPKLKLFCDAPWDVAPDHTRLSILANMAAGYLDSEWNFMLQADEVIHEGSYADIREIVDTFDPVFSVNVRRLNFYGNPGQHVRFDIPLSEKPCDDTPTRLAPSSFRAIGDGESLEKKENTITNTDIVICHYGFVRDPIKLVNRTVSSLEWFFPHPVPDERFIAMQRDGEYRWTDIMRQDQMQQYNGKHPKVIKPWLAERWGQ